MNVASSLLYDKLKFKENGEVLATLETFKVAALQQPRESAGGEKGPVGGCTLAPP